MNSEVKTEDFQENLCRDCNMKFDSIQEYANHKEKFCINSDYFDPLKLQEKIQSSQMSTSSMTGAMTFEQVKKYLETQDTLSVEASNVGKVTLQDLKSQFQNNEIEMERMRNKVKKQRSEEKADEVRILKVKQQKARLQKQQEEDEIQELVSEIESRREAELRARMEKEHIKTEIRNLHNEGLSALEAERKRELANLVKEKELLLAREAEAKREIDLLEQNVISQERAFREQQRVIEQSLLANKDEAKATNRKDEVRKRHMEMSKNRGEQAAKLKHTHNTLTSERHQVEQELEKYNDEGTKDSLSQMVERIDLKGQADKVRKMKEAMSEGRVADEEILRVLDHELETNVTQIHRPDDHEAPHADELSKFLDEFVQDSDASKSPVVVTSADGKKKETQNNVVLKELDKYQNQSSSPESKSPKSSKKIEPQVSDDDDEDALDREMKQSNNNSAPIDQRPVHPPSEQPPAQAHHHPHYPPPHYGNQHSSNTGPPQGPPPSYQYHHGHGPNPNPEYPYAPHYGDPYQTQNSYFHPPQYPGAGAFHHPGYAHHPVHPNVMPFYPHPHFQPPVHHMTSAPVQTPQSMLDPQQHQLLMQQETENARLQQELEAMLNRKEAEEMDREKERLDKMMSKLHKKIQPPKWIKQYKQNVSGGDPGAHEDEDEDDAENGNTTNHGGKSSDDKKSIWEDHAADLAFMEHLPQNSHLRQLQLKHIEQVVKMQFEMDKLRRANELEDMRTKLEKQKQDKAEEVAHESWMSQQKRELMALRMNKVLAKEKPYHAQRDIYVYKPYNPECGFTVFFDFVLDVPSKADFIQFRYAAYEGPVERKAPKSIRKRECERQSPNDLAKCIVATKRTFEKVSQLANYRLLIELSRVNSRQKVSFLGWTLLDIFGSESDRPLALCVGKFKLPVLTTAMPDMTQHLSSSSSSASLINDPPATGQMSLYVRVVHGEDTELAHETSVDPDITSGYYTLPSKYTSFNHHQHAAEDSESSKGRRKPARGTSAKSSTRKMPSHEAQDRSTTSLEKYPLQSISEPESLQDIDIDFQALSMHDDAMHDLNEDSISLQLRYVNRTDTTSEVDKILTTFNAVYISQAIPVNDREMEHQMILREHVHLEDVAIQSQRLVLSIHETQTRPRVWGLVDLEGVETTSDMTIPLYRMSKDNHVAMTAVRNSEEPVGQIHLRVSLAEVVVHEDDEVEEGDSPRSLASSSAYSRQTYRSESHYGSQSQLNNPMRNHWLSVNHKQTNRKVYQLFSSGDGFDVYVDGARSLPDCVSMTKVTCLAMASDMSPVSPDVPVSGFAQLDSSVYSPMYNLQIEYRAERVNPTLTLAFRIDTIACQDNQYLPKLVGYATLAVFLDTQTRCQITKANAQDLFLNHGCFQLPLCSAIQSGTDELDFNERACDHAIRLPCSTLLVRIVPAAKSEDGTRTLCRADVPKSDWIKTRVVEPTPDYLDAVYDSTRCIPSPVEETLYSLRSQHRDSSNSAATLRTKVRAVAEALEQNPEDQTWYESILENKPTGSLDLTRIAKSQPEIGFKVSIDGMHNLTASKSFYKVIYCLNPPAPFYQDPKLTEDVQFTISNDWKSAAQSVEFKDGYFTYRNYVADENLNLLIDIRAITYNAKKKTFASSHYGWTSLHILNSDGCIAAGSYQLPIFSGALTTDIANYEGRLSELIAADQLKKKKKDRLCNYVVGASVFVRIEDNQVPKTCPEPFDEARGMYLPQATKAKYIYDPKKIGAQRIKHPVMKHLPKDSTMKSFEKEMNTYFSNEMDITHISF